MKAKEELNLLKEEVEKLNAKLAELTEEELEQVFGGTDSGYIKIKIVCKACGKECNSLAELRNHACPKAILIED